MSLIEMAYDSMKPALQSCSPEDGIKSLQNLVKAFPDFARAHNDLGMMYHHSGEKQRALGHLEYAVRISPESTVYAKNLADYYYVELGRSDDALAIYRKLIEAQPSDVQTLMTAGHMMVGLHRFAEAQDCYAKVLKVEPWNAEADENSRKIAKILTREEGGPEPEKWYADAVSLANDGKLRDARTQLEKLISVHPEFAPAHNDVGVICYRSGEKERALRCYEEACRLQPESPTFRKNLADFYWVEQGRAEDALKLYVKVLEGNPEDVETLTALARICLGLSRREDARTFYERILEIEPWNAEAGQALDAATPARGAASQADSPEDLYAEAGRLVTAGDAAAGREHLLQLVACHPNFAPAQNDLAVLAYQAGDREGAVERCRRAVELEPANLTYRKNLAEFYWIGLGRYEDALKIYVEILSAYPEDLESLLATAKICLCLERPEDARVFFERMLEIEPWNAEAGQALDRLAVKAA